MSKKLVLTQLTKKSQDKRKMELFNEDNSTATVFINRNTRNHEDDNLGLRCMRKKYKCVMIWLLSIISVTQFLIIIFQKLDDTMFNMLVEKLASFIKLNHTSSQNDSKT